MIQLRILSGQKAGQSLVVRRFPCTLGREPGASLRLEDPGVWEQHAALDFQPPDSIKVRVRPDASLLVNGQRVQEAILRAGDRLELGAAKISFSLSPVTQRGLRFRETLVWTGLVLLLLAQLALIRWVLP
jgi:pSer/pThr/pTyr-binding forkhead associated (FHA) protein